MIFQARVFFLVLAFSVAVVAADLNCLHISKSSSGGFFFSIQLDRQPATQFDWVAVQCVWNAAQVGAPQIECGPHLMTLLVLKLRGCGRHNQAKYNGPIWTLVLISRQSLIKNESPTLKYTVVGSAEH